MLRLTATLDDVLNLGKEGQPWILLWDRPASTPARPPWPTAFPHVVLCFISPHSTSFLQPCDVGVFRCFKSCIQAQANTTLARSVIDGSFDNVVMNKAWRRQASAEGASCAVTDLCDQAWTTGWRRLRAHSDAELREPVAKAVLTASPGLPDSDRHNDFFDSFVIAAANTDHEVYRVCNISHEFRLARKTDKGG